MGDPAAIAGTARVLYQLFAELVEAGVLLDSEVVGAVAATHLPEPRVLVRVDLETWEGNRGLLLRLGYVLDSSCPWTRLGVLPWRVAPDEALLAAECALHVAATLSGGNAAS